jgi:voltage-gated potassium channel
VINVANFATDPRARRIALAMIVPLFWLVLGTVGYARIEGWRYFDAAYMTVITLGTVGYGETLPLSETGRIFTMVLILGGVFTTTIAATSVITALVSGELQRVLGRQRMERNLNQMKNHVIVCGYGRMGKLVCEEMHHSKIPFVIVDRDEHLPEIAHEKNSVAIVGDATLDETLRRAGIERARALVTVLPHDADNLFITMSARLLNDKVFIVARAEDPHSETKLLKAGANRVVAPYLLGGGRVVQAVLRPNVLDFIDLATRTQNIELQMEETEVEAGCMLAGKKLSESVRREHKVIVVAVKKNTGKLEFNPGGETMLEIGDTLISLGHRNDLDRLDEMGRASN